jgi:hypothetical protein
LRVRHKTAKQCAQSRQAVFGIRRPQGHDLDLELAALRAEHVVLDQTQHAESLEPP